MQTSGTTQQSIEVRRKYVRAFNATMVKIWREQIALLGVIDTGALYRSTVGISMTADGKFIDIKLSQAFNTYGLFVDYGTGRNTPRGNPGDIGKANGRKRKRWFSRKYFGDEHSGILRRLLRSGVLPRHLQRPQPRYYASRSHSVIPKYLLRK